MNIIGFVTANWKELLLAATSIVTFASIISKFTKNTWDDTITAKLLRLLSLAPAAPTALVASQVKPKK